MQVLKMPGLSEKTFNLGASFCLSSWSWWAA